MLSLSLHCHFLLGSLALYICSLSSLSSAISIFSPFSPPVELTSVVCFALPPLYFAHGQTDTPKKKMFSCTQKHTQSLLGISFTCKNAHILHTSMHTPENTHTDALKHTHAYTSASSLCFHVCLSSNPLNMKDMTSLFVLPLSLPPSLVSLSRHLSIITPHLSPPHLFNSIPLFLSLLILPTSLPSASPPLCHYSPLPFFTSRSSLTSSFHLVSPFFFPTTQTAECNNQGPSI